MLIPFVSLISSFSRFVISWTCVKAKAARGGFSVRLDNRGRNEMGESGLMREAALFGRYFRGAKGDNGQGTSGEWSRAGELAIKR